MHEYTLDPHAGTLLELGFAGTDEPMTLRIYDKAGLLKHEANFSNDDMTWDGSDKTGHFLSNGVYLYSLFLGSELLEKGYITIVNTR